MIKKRVLLVDDEKEILDLNKEAFEFFDFHVFTALSVEEAVVILKKNDVDYILTDYQMPGKNGMDLVKTVRGELSMTTPISFLTAHTLDKNDPLEALGVQKVFSKPLDIDEVIGFIGRYLNKVGTV